MATVTLLVGDNKKVFHIHEANLFEASSFFKAAFNSDFRESSERSMTLPEDDDFVFELFVEWIYRGCYKLPLTQVPIPDLITYKRHVQLFVLADKYNVPNLKTAVLSELFIIIKKREYWPDADTIAYAFEHTFQNSLIRQFLADHMACNWPSAKYKDPEIQGWLRAHPDISTEVNMSFAKHRTDWQSFFCGDIPEEYLEKKEPSKK